MVRHIIHTNVSKRTIFMCGVLTIYIIPPSPNHHAHTRQHSTTSSGAGPHAPGSGGGLGRRGRPPGRRGPRGGGPRAPPPSPSAWRPSRARGRAGRSAPPAVRSMVIRSSWRIGVRVGWTAVYCFSLALPPLSFSPSSRVSIQKKNTHTHNQKRPTVTATANNPTQNPPSAARPRRRETGRGPRPAAAAAAGGWRPPARGGGGGPAAPRGTCGRPVCECGF